MSITLTSPLSLATPTFIAFRRAGVRVRQLAVPLVFVVGFGATGCITTRAEGEALRQDVDALKDETARLQTEVADLRSQRGNMIDKIGNRVDALESTLASLRQNDADTGVQMEKVVAEVQLLRGELEEARHELGEQKETVASILARPPVTVSSAATAPKEEDPNKPTQIGGADVPVEPKAHYDFAKRLFDDKKFADAAEAFDLFLTRHAKVKDLVDNAAFWKAESFYQLASAAPDKAGKEKAYKQAILSYQRVLESPSSEKGDGALFKIGLAFEALGFDEEARVFYDELLQKYPKSPLAKEAKKRLKALKPAKKKK